MYNYNSDKQIGVFLKINLGYNRCGVEPKDTFTIDKILLNLSKNTKNLVFKGFLSHAG